MNQNDDNDLSLLNDDDSERVAERLSLLGKAAIDRFILQLSDKSDSKLKASALHVLGYMQEESAFDLIVEQLKSNDLTVAQAVVDSLKSFNTVKSRSVLLSLLKDERPSLKRKSLKALNELGVQVQKEQLDKLLNDNSWMVREELVYYLAKGLVEFGDEFKSKLLTDSHVLVKKTANKYL